MRTTVELSDALYRRLCAAAERDMRGFSELIEEALTRYLERDDERRDLVRAIEAAEGTWTDADVAEWEQARNGAWARWRAERFSTTS